MITMLVSLFHEITSVTRSMRLEQYLWSGQHRRGCFVALPHKPDASIPRTAAVSLIIARVLVVTGDLKLDELFSFKTISRRGRTNYTDLRQSVTDLLLPLMCRIKP